MYINTYESNRKIHVYKAKTRGDVMRHRKKFIIGDCNIPF